MKLITFGCSITYGYCLINVLDAWPYQVGKMFNLPVKNEGVPGASNLQILHNILNFKFDPQDTVIVMWSNPDRDFIYNEDGTASPVGSWAIDSLSKNWILTHNERDTAIRSWYYMHHAKLYFESLKLKYKFYCIDYEYMKTFKPSFLDVYVGSIDVNTLRKCDYATDNSHPGPKGHLAIANEIFKDMI